VNPEYLALVKIGVLLEKISPGEAIKLEKLIGTGGLTELIEKTFKIHVYNGEAAIHILERILGEIDKSEGSDSDMSDPYTKTFS